MKTEKTTKAHKKICPKCGQRLWLRDFYKLKDGNYSSYCKSCQRAWKREQYAKHRKIKDGIYMDFETGRLIEHKGYKMAIHLSEPMKEKLKRIFPTTKNEECAIEFGVSQRTIARWAKQLGLTKDIMWMRNHHLENCKTMRVINMCVGNAGMFKKGEHANPAGEFKKKTI